MLAACGGDDGGGGKQDEVADMLLESMEDEGVDMDDGCVRDAAQQLSDDDAQTLLDAGPDGRADDLGAEADEVVNNLLDCVDTDALVDEMIDDMVDDIGADNVDVDCVKDALRDLDLASIDEGDSAMMTALLECMSVGG